MVLKVEDVERLVTHYLWMLDDLKVVRDLVGDWGFDVGAEKKLVLEARRVLLKMLASGRTVI